MGQSLLVLYVIAFAFVADGKIFEPIELARKLHSIKISDWDIPSLVCLAHNASQLNTSHIEVKVFGALNQNITFYGIFGIPEAWIDKCLLDPPDVTDEDIENDIRCVLKNLKDRLTLFERTDYLGALTPHIVDLNKCFDWWEDLPHYVISSNERFELPACHSTATATSISPDPTHSTTTVHKPHPPVTTNCKCDSKSGGFIVDFSLIFLNITLVVLCYILWVSFVQRRTVNSESVQFI